MEGSSSGSDTTPSPPPPSPSFASELFGSTESPSSSTGIFGSIFAPPPKVFERESVRSGTIPEKPKCSSDEAWDDNKTQNPGHASIKNEGENEEMPNKERESIYQDQRVQPCHLSSSIYYGGQDIYSHPQSNAGSDSSFSPPAKKDGEGDESESASRGNWWQGSLYY